MTRAVPTLLAIVLAAAACTRPLPPVPGTSVLLLSVDSLRTDRLRPWSEDGPPMPNLADLQARGTVFTDAWTVAPWTAPAMVSVFTGRYPPSHGVAVRDDTTPPQIATVVRVLGNTGYRVGNLSFFSGISYFRNLGLPPPEEGLRHRREAEALGRFLDRGEGPFVAWVHLLEPHLPYGASGYRAREVTVPGSSGLERAQLQAELPVGSARFAPGDRERLLALYDHDLELLDRAIGRVLDELEERGLREQTLVVLVADHGEEILDDGWVGHASTTVEAKLLREILHVPLVLAGPGVPAGVVSDARVQHVDLLPTLCRMLGVEPPPGLDGRALRLYADAVRSPRETLYFDTSVGGNLTPVERRRERLQAASDGGCLVQLHLGTGVANAPTTRELVSGGCRGPRVDQLTARLERWQHRQAERRLEVLAADSSRRPDPEAVAAMALGLTIREPATGEALDWDGSDGQIVIDWEAPAAEPQSYWIEYEATGGGLPIRGAFRVSDSRVAFGPFPQGFWNDVAARSPFRFRVLAPDEGVRSPWTRLRLEPAS